MESELFGEMAAPAGAPSALYVHDHTNLKFSPFFHIILHCKTTENYVKSSFHDCCYRHFCLWEGCKCFGLTSTIRKITHGKNAVFLLLFQKISSRQKTRGNAPAPK